MSAATGAKSSIGTSAVALTSTSNPISYKVGIRAASGNSGTVYVGLSSAVTAGSSDTTDGFPLAAGEYTELTRSAVSDTTGVYLIASGAGQKVFWAVDVLDDISTSGSSGGGGAVTNAGTFVVQENGASLTALQLIDDVVLAEDAVHATGDKGVMSLAVRKDTAAQTAGTDGDYCPLITDSTGRLHVNVGNTVTVGSHEVTNAGTFAVQATLQAGTALAGQVIASQETSTLYNGSTALTPKFAAIAAATSGDNTLVAAVTSKKIRVLALCVVAGAAGNIYFTSAVGGTVIFGGSTNKINLAINGGFVLPYSPVGWFETSSGHLLNMNASSTGPFSGGLTYIEV